MIRPPLARWPPLVAATLLVIAALTCSAVVPAPVARSTAPSPAVPTLAAPTPAATPATAPAPAIAWFHLPAAAARDWEMTADPADPWQLTLRPRVTPPAGTLVWRVWVLFAKPSLVYEPAMATLLADLASRQMAVTWTLVDFRADPGRGRRALADAAAHADLLLAMGSDSTDFTSREARGGPIPVLSVLAKDPVLLGQIADYTHGSGSNLAFTSVGMPVAVQLAYLRELRPGLRALVILYDQDNRSAISTQVEPLRAAAGAAGILVTTATSRGATTAHADLLRELPAALAAAAQVDPGGGNTLCWVTGSTEVIGEVATVVRLAATVPVVSAFPDLVRPGPDSAAVAIGVSFDSAAHLAATLAARLLRGEVRAGDLPVGTVSPPDIAINFQRTRAIGLRIPFHFFESASVVVDGAGQLAWSPGLGGP